MKKNYANLRERVSYSSPSVENLTVSTENGFAATGGGDTGLGTPELPGNWGDDDDTNA